MRHGKHDPSREISRSAAVSEHDFFKKCLLEYGESHLFADVDEWVMEDNPYRRPLRPHVFEYLDFSKPLTRDQLLTYTSLTANRTLLTIYENDFVLLPRRDFAAKRADFEEFYGRRASVLGAVVRPWLESFLFDFLKDEIAITGCWTRAALQSYFEDFAAEVDRRGEDGAMAAILASADPVHAAKTFLIQMSGDFLLESSAMMRTAGGHYGTLQSEMFKILIDEYGYGVHETKHSTLFERALESVGLCPLPHGYWQFYLSSSMLLNNYYNYVCRDHGKLFRYLGALFQAETAFIHSCSRMVHMMRSVFGAGAEVRYFTEHAHIDRHHSKMVFDRLIKPAVETHGDGIIPDIVRGFEESKLLGEIAERDFVDQVAWSDGGSYYKALAPTVHARIRDGVVKPRVQRFVEPRGELSVTHVHDGDELCYIQSGVMKFVTGHERHVLLNAGEGTVIKRNRLHGAIIESAECTYDISSIGDYQKCLS